jgi:hypothetical protein
MSWVTGLVTAVLTAAAVAGVNWLMQYRKEQTNRRAERMAEQINKPYGPLYFYTSQNADLICPAPDSPQA